MGKGYVMIILHAVLGGILCGIAALTVAQGWPLWITAIYGVLGVLNVVCALHTTYVYARYRNG